MHDARLSSLAVAMKPILFNVALFALALGGNPELLQRVAAAVLWLSVLLAGLHAAA